MMILALEKIKDSELKEEFEKLVLKNTPMKPIIDKVYDEDWGCTFTVATCPNCGSVAFNCANYCKDCGQRLDWRGRKSEK